MEKIHHKKHLTSPGTVSVLGLIYEKIIEFFKYCHIFLTFVVLSYE